MKLTIPIFIIHENQIGRDLKKNNPTTHLLFNIKILYHWGVQYKLTLVTTHPEVGGEKTEQPLHQYFTDSQISYLGFCFWSWIIESPGR